MLMGRPRKSNQLGLESRVYARHGAFYYAHRDGKWERLGTDVGEANRKARLYNDTRGVYGTMAYWLDMWVVECEKRVQAKTLAQRTYDDYKADIEPLKVYFAPPMLPTDIEPKHVQDYLDIGAQAGRPVRANREKAALSSCISWLIRSGSVDGLVVNPCLRASGIKRNSEKPRDRYVTDADYLDVYAVAPRMVRAMMTMVYRTLQRPDPDVLTWTRANIIVKDGARVLRNRQSKTGKVVDIGLTEELDALIKDLSGEIPVLHRPLIHNREDNAYTYDGLSAMLKRAIKKANEARAKAGAEKIAPFGFRDMKGKGATDMWRTGVPLEQIQLLCGHDDITTTEIYVKQRWRETATTNQVQMAV